MPVRLQQLLLLATLLALAIGCKPEIGDDCQLSTDCSAQGDRLCDITAPGGYCTVFNCEPNSCPEDESLCLQFGSQRSPVDACQDAQSSSPYARAFCMATCEENGDCRDGYECANVADPANRWGAILIDQDRGDRACMVRVHNEGVFEPSEGDVPDGESFGEVCHAEVPDPEPEPEPEPDPAGGGQGAGGQDSGSGAASGSGSGAGGADAGAAGAGG
jgi:hypothetical protein